MPPGLKIWTACTALAVRTRPTVLRSGLDAFRLAKGPIRRYSDDGNGPPGRPTKPPGPQTAPSPARTPSNDEALHNQNVPHSSEDKATTDESAQNGQADPTWEAKATDQGTFLDAISQTELLEAMYGGKLGYVQSEGNLTDAQLDKLYEQGTIPYPEEVQSSTSGALKPQGEEIGQDSSQPPSEDPSKVEDSGIIKGSGLKFEPITKPYPAEFNMKKRYHPVLDQLTRLLMRDGKLSVAQRNMAMVLTYMRTSPAPIYSPKYPLLPGTPPASYLPLNPVLYITIAIDSVAPLISIRHVAGGAGGGRALEIPVPLAVRQRRRIAFKWILDLINKRPSRGSGRKQFPTRVAEEIIAVVEGRSSAWERRTQIHKLGTAARANVGKRAIKKWG